MLLFVLLVFVNNYVVLTSKTNIIFYYPVILLLLTILYKVFIVEDSNQDSFTEMSWFIVKENIDISYVLIKYNVKI